MDDCTESSDMRAVAAWRRFSSFEAPVADFDGVLARSLEKYMREVSSTGWKTMRAIREPKCRGS
jgi:hypothetical protein